MLSHSASVLSRAGLSAGLFSYSMTRSVKTEGCQASPGRAPGHFPLDPGLSTQGLSLWCSGKYLTNDALRLPVSLVPATLPALSPGRGGGKRCSDRGWLQDLVLGQDPALTATITAWRAGKMRERWCQNPDLGRMP